MVAANRVGHEACGLGQVGRAPSPRRRDRAGRGQAASATGPAGHRSDPTDRAVWVNPCSSTRGGPSPRRSTGSATAGERTGHLQRNPRRRMGAPRRERRRHLPGLAFDAPRPRPRRPPDGARAARRAQRRLLRPRAGHGDGAADDRVRHERHRCGRAAPGCRRGTPRPGAADRVHGGPPARAAPHRGATDDRAGGPLRGGDALGRRAGGPDGRAARDVAATCRPRFRRGGARTARARARPPQPRIPRTA